MVPAATNRPECSGPWRAHRGNVARTLAPRLWSVVPHEPYVALVDTPRLEHVRVNVSDFRRALTWYESILVLPARSHWPPEDPKYAHFDTGGAQFAISELDPVPAAGRYNFSVIDVDSWWAKLRDRAEVVEELYDTPYGSRKFTIKDPDGNELGFVRED